MLSARTRIRMGGRVATAAFAAVAVAQLIAPAPAAAHALVGKQDLPIPEYLFVAGAGAVLIVSFVALLLGWHRARFQLEQWRPVSERVSGLLVNRWTELLAGLVGVGLLGVTIWAGLTGTEAPDRNFAVTFVFVTAWLGLVVLSLAFGDIFRAFNPWRAVARVFAAGFQLIAGQSPPPPLRYPEWLGRWPAVVGLIGFGWMELVYGQTGFQAVGLTPHSVALATLIYSAWTFVGMALFGIDKWLDRGETFSVYFGMFSRLALLEVREGRLGVRRPFTGTIGWASVPGSAALVLVTIGITAFDGAQEGLLQDAIASTFEAMIDGGAGPVTALRLTNSLYFAGTLLTIAAIYWAGVTGMHAAGGSLDTLRLGRAFAHTFIPIAVAYLVAHYFTLVVFQEQAQFTFLLSDPLGDGSDYFGTAGGGIDYALISATAVWYVQVAALVIGHVTALVLGHDRAIALYGDTRTAALSQLWMLVLMVGFTTLGLLLLSQANA
jgi:hypothetical protein